MLSSDKPPVASTWLDRLRLSKGLSTTGEDEDASGTPLTLDDFLLRNHHTETDSPPTPSDPELTDSPSDPDPDPNHAEWYGVMSDVLSDLFNFGVSSAIRGKKKFPRKQSNPKHCSVETPPQRISSFLPKFATSAAEKRRRRSVEEDDDVEEEEGEKDLVGFSRSEVTVIDTSFEIWKTEKVVFRRRSVWKVREKKGNYSRGVVSSKKKKIKIKKKKKKKKRKCDVDDGQIGRKSKKIKLSDNNPQYLSEELPESSNANQTLLLRLPSKPRSVLHTSKRNNEPESCGHSSLA